MYFWNVNKNKIDKETAIKSILSDLKKGIDKPAIVSKIAHKCPKTNERTIRRWFESASIKYQEFMSKAQPIIEAKEAEALAEVAASGILSKIERQKILTDIALGNIIVPRTIFTKMGAETIEEYPSHSDRRAAIAELNKMDGDYAPNKTEHSGEITTNIISLGNGINPNEAIN